MHDETPDDARVHLAECALAVRETLQGIDGALGTLRELLAAIERHEATTAAPNDSTDIHNPFSEELIDDSLGLIANGVKLVTTILATAGDGDMALTRRDLHGMTLVMGAIGSAIKHEQKRLKGGARWKQAPKG